MGLDVHTVTLGHALEHHPQVQLAHAVEHRLVHARMMLDAHARILRHQLVQAVREALFLATPFRFDGDAEHRRRERDRLEVKLILIVRVVEHRVEMQLVDLRDGADVARNAGRDFGVLLAQQAKQVRDLEGLARIADEQLAAVAHGALVNPEQAELADEGIDRDFEHVRDDVPRGIRFHLGPLGVITFALEEGRRITLSRVRHQAADDVEQFVNASTSLSGDEADGDEVTFAQRTLEGIVQLLGVDLLALLEIERHQIVIELDHLVDDLGVRGFGRAEVRRAAPRLEETIDDLGTALGRQVERQALAPEHLAHLGECLLDTRLAAVDLVDDHDAAQLAFLGEGHHPLGDRFHARDGADHHADGLDGFENAQRSTDEVRKSRRVDQVDARITRLEGADRCVQGVLELFFLRIVVAHGRAARQVPLGANRARVEQQRFGKKSLARTGVTDQCQIANIGSAIGHDRFPASSCFVSSPPLRLFFLSLPAVGERARVRVFKSVAAVER